MSCTKTEAPSIIVDKTEIAAEFTGLQETIGVKCNREWSATSDVNWITMSHAAEDAFEAPSYILVTVQANDGEIRTGNITIASKSGNLSAVVTIRQGENTEIIRNADRFVEYMKLVAAGKANDNYRLGSDIDLSGKTLPEITEMNYTFDGQNHVINNWTTSSPLFGKIGTNGSVRNLIIGESCALSSTMTEGGIGFICGQNNGTIEGCVNKGNVSVSSESVLDKGLYVAGLVGTGSGIISSCSNEGNVSVSVQGSSNVLVAAGVVGNVGSGIASCNNSGNVTLTCESSEGKADGSYKAVSVAGVAGVVSAENGKINDCSNSGNIIFRGGYSLGVQTVGKITKFASNVSGVVGVVYKCSIDNCTNSGTLTSRVGDIGNASSVYQTTARQSVGGVVSSPWGKVSNCKNTGMIDVDWITAEHSAGLAKNFVGQIGGVAGGDYNSDAISSSMEGCVNEGNIDIVMDASQSNSAFGGVTGWGGKEAAAGVNVVQNCKNSGNIVLDGFGKSRIGGVSGSPVKLVNCMNSGEVYLKGGNTGCSVGGVIGFGNFFNVTGCENYGTVKSDVKLAGAETSASGGIGGLAGAVGNTVMEYSGCMVNCSVNAPAGSAGSMLVGVIGHNKSGGKAFTVGTAASPNKIKGYFNGVEVTADNYQTYMRRPDFKLVNKNVTFNVEYLK